MQKAVRDALIAFMPTTAEAQAEAHEEAQRAGISRVKANQPQSYRARKPALGRSNSRSSGT
jgi:putative DNA-invertase from lambdoid prophage Rac